MSPKNFRKICHPEAKILNNIVNCAHSDCQTDRQTVETRCRADPTSSGSANNRFYQIFYNFNNCCFCHFPCQKITCAYCHSYFSFQEYDILHSLITACAEVMLCSYLAANCSTPNPYPSPIRQVGVSIIIVKISLLSTLYYPTLLTR